MKHFKNIDKFSPTVYPHIHPLYFKVLMVKFSTKYLHSHCRLKVMQVTVGIVEEVLDRFMHLRNSWLKGTVNREQYNVTYIITVHARLGEKRED